METPSHEVSSFDHFVTQWISVRMDSLGRSRNSSQVQLLGSETSPTMVEEMRRDHPRDDLEIPWIRGPCIYLSLARGDRTRRDRLTRR